MGVFDPGCLTTDGKYNYAFATVYRNKRNSKATEDDPQYNIIVKSSADLETFRSSGWSFLSAIPAEITRSFPGYSDSVCHADSKGTITIASSYCKLTRISDTGDCAIQWSPTSTQNKLAGAIGSGGWTLIDTTRQDYYWSDATLISINNQLMGFSVGNNPLTTLNYTVLDESSLRFRDESMLINLESLLGFIGAISYPGNDKLYMAGFIANETFLATTQLNSTSLLNPTFDPSPTMSVDILPTDLSQACDSSDGSYKTIKALRVIGNSTYIICAKGYPNPRNSSRVDTIYHHDGINWTPINLNYTPWRIESEYQFINSTSGNLWVHVSDSVNSAYSIEIFPNNTATWKNENAITIEEDFTNVLEGPKSNTLTIGLSIGGGVIFLILICYYIIRRRRRKVSESIELQTINGKEIIID